MKHFNQYMNGYQVRWRHNNLNNQTMGDQKGQKHPWILPLKIWKEGLWPGIRNSNNSSLIAYIQANDFQKHDCAHNLKSSWVLCANLYFPFRNDTSLMAGFLKEYISQSIREVEKIELEYQDPDESLHSAQLLGEPAGQPGKNQTLPNIAFLLKLANGKKGLILTEVKFTEDSFKACPGRQKKSQNPDPERCLNFKQVLEATAYQCHQLQWQGKKRRNRKYWDYLSFAPEAINTLRCCPASIAGCQLFRHQALAEALALKGPYDLVVSAIAYDERNHTLIGCLRSTGIDDFTTGWEPLFNGKARFVTFTHQDWASWVREHDTSGKWKEWSEYVKERYGI